MFSFFHYEIDTSYIFLLKILEIKTHMRYFKQFSMDIEVLFFFNMKYIWM